MSKKNFVSRGSNLNLAAEPRIKKFEFPSDGRVNDRVSVTCTTKSGSPPFQFEWMRNGIPLTKNDRISFGTIEDASVLTFRQLKEEDVANYTCMVRNNHGMDTFTAPLVMRSKCLFLNICHRYILNLFIL